MSGTLIEQYETLWNSAENAPDVFEFLSQHGDSTKAERLAVLLLDQRKRWVAGKPITVEEYLQRLPELAKEPDCKLELAVGEYQVRQKSAQWPSVQEFLSRFSDIIVPLKYKLLDAATVTKGIDSSEFSNTVSFAVDSNCLTDRIGRYRVLRVLGEGTFGRVYLGFDDELQRPVAIKVPNPERLRGPGDADAFLTEARTVASLDHPNIVPVHDLGRSNDGTIYVVSRFIQGSTLGERIREKRLDFQETAQILARVAQALDHAHQNRVIHRDVKPGNILLEEQSGTPYVADFGLALRDMEYLTDGKLVGTPSYMSPEQARGEGHRLDGRSDIFALGAVFYLMLTGRKAFEGSTVNEILHAVISVEPAAPRDIDDTIPAELERICLKTLSKRVSERHASAAELADDLLRWHQMPEQKALNRQFVPRGLRSFDASDADVFLDLLPGLRNREGLPESIQFWKTQLEEMDPDATFPVGLIYGPSGCGKSSLVKAGLLPRLARHVLAIYVEATPADTESRILRGIRKCLPDLSSDLGLVQTLQFLRHKKNKKIVLIIDQFEQWLHSSLASPDNLLVAALRHCDGGSLQAVVMVRDDFAMAAARFMDAIDIPIVQGHNFATIDLFDEQHAAKVLARFGQAFGKLPAKRDDFTNEQSVFLTSVVTGLAVEGKVVPVQLALFAEMIKTKPWKHATLQQVGGTAGIGVNFLEETFSSRSANPKHLQHQQAARNVLKVLLPDVGSDIKGHMKSQDELLQISGYQQHLKQFNELLRILDGELRLITPTDPEGFRSGSGSDALSKRYQLTHDYLVPSLREWLTRKQAETQRGRMELRLQERTSLWSGRHEQKQLPSFLEWHGIMRHTSRSSWTASNATMMRSATRLYLFRLLTGLGLAAVFCLSAVWIEHMMKQRAKSARIENLVDDLWKARIEHVPEILETLAPDRPTWIHLARSVADDPDSTVSARTRAMLVLSEQDDMYLSALADRLLECEADEHVILRNGLASRQREVADVTWSRINRIELTRGQIIRAGALLAHFSLDAEHWELFSGRLADALVRSDPFEVNPWLKDLAQVRLKLLPRLSETCLAASVNSSQRSLAASVIAQFSESDAGFPEAPVLLELALTSDASVRDALDSVFSQRRADVLPLLVEEIAVRLEGNDSPEYQEVINRQAAAVEQAQRLGHDAPFWQHLNDDADPRVRTVLINEFGHVALSWNDIRQRLRTQPSRCRQAIVLGLPQRLPSLSASQQSEMTTLLLQLYRTDPDAGVHSSIEFALRSTGSEAQLFGAQQLMMDSEVKAGNWSVLSNGICMISLDRPGLVSHAQKSKDTGTGGKYVTIDYPFEISSTEITVRQFQQFRADAMPAAAVTSSADCPMNSVNLFQAMQFCRWLSEQDPDFNPDRCVYPPIDTIGPGLLLAADYQRWPGFRLPTVDEWEYAVRAGSGTSRFFGNSDEHLSQYCWWVFTSAEHLWRVGLKRPNPWGLFDVYGNVEEWCHDAGTPFDSARQPNRGGEYRSTQRFLGSAIGGNVNSESAFSTQGFRVVRIKPGE